MQDAGKTSQSGGAHVEPSVGRKLENLVLNEEDASSQSKQSTQQSSDAASGMPIRKLTQRVVNA